MYLFHVVEASIRATLFLSPWNIKKANGVEPLLEKIAISFNDSTQKFCHQVNIMMGNLAFKLKLNYHKIGSLKLARLALDLPDNKSEKMTNINIKICKCEYTYKDLNK